uniref:DM10 domain-containing protein n=1 Tax=Panagrellus redivivus TaxID=6233 RepID=A0A7E4V941_PANRE
MSLEAKIKRLVAGNKIRFDAPRQPREFRMQTPAEIEAQLADFWGPDFPESALRITPRPQLHQHIMQFHGQTPKHRPYLYPHYGHAFTGRTAKRVLNSIVGPDADFLGEFLFQKKIVRKIGFGRVNGIISDDTLYRIDQKTLFLRYDEIVNGDFPEETGYFERRAAMLHDSQS